MAEKKSAYDVDAGSVPTSRDEDLNRGTIGNIVKERGADVGEAADIYGSVESAEKYGYVHRGLKSRHIQ